MCRRSLGLRYLRLQYRAPSLAAIGRERRATAGTVGSLCFQRRPVWYDFEKEKATSCLRQKTPSKHWRKVLVVIPRLFKPGPKLFRKTSSTSNARTQDSPSEIR